MPTEHQSTSRQAKWEETILFFLSAVGCTLGWTAVLSNLVYYTDTLGVNSYVYLNLCIYAPLFPITLAQALWDADFDRQFTSLKSFWVRGSVGFTVTLLSTVLLASGYMGESLWSVSLLSLALGTSSGILHGALKQMASFVYPGCGRLAAAVTAGLQASAVFILIVSLLTPGSSATSSHWLHSFYAAIAVLVALCWLGFQRLMSHSQDIYRSMLRRDSSIQLTGSVVSFNENDNEEEPASEYFQAEDDQLLNSTLNLPKNGAQEQDKAQSPQTQPLLLPSSSTDSEDLTVCGNNNRNNTTNPQQQFWTLTPMMKQLIQQSWPLCVAIFLTVASSMAVASWFNRVPSTSQHHPDRLPQVLFYTRLFADLLSRPATLLLPSSSNPDAAAAATAATTSPADKQTLWYLLGLVTVRLFFVPYFFLYVTTTWMPHSDLAMTMGVFAFAFSSGFITTWAYQLAPRYCKASNNTERQSLLASSRQQTEANESLFLQQTNLLNVCFSASVLLGLIGSLSLTGMKTSGESA